MFKRLSGRTYVDRICAYKPCSKPFKLPKGLRNICCCKTCGNKLRGEMIHNNSWAWKQNKIRKEQMRTARKEKEDKEKHLKTIFTGGYDKENDKVIYGYTEGEIV